MEPKASISFMAESVEVFEDEYTLDHVVFGLHFGQGDPEKGGEHWNFTRSMPEEQSEALKGVCTVKEIQQVTVYGGIRSLSINSRQLSCKFDEDAALKTGVSNLVIGYTLADKQWDRVQKTAERLFGGEGYFTLDRGWNR